MQFHARWASQAVKGYTEEVFGELARLWRIEESESFPGARGSEAGLSVRPRQLEGPARESQDMRQGAQ